MLSSALPSPQLSPETRDEKRFASLSGVYHVELRQFPHNFCHFNLTAQALRETVLDAWARGEWVEIGERRWNPQQATLTVIEGPELPVQQLSMGRGWRNAVRQGTDVTATLLADARARLGFAESGPAEVPEPARGPSPGTARSAWAAVTGPARKASDRPALAGQAGTGDHLVRQLLSLLGENPGPLLRAWQLAMEQHPDRTPSQCLAAAEDFVGR